MNVKNFKLVCNICTIFYRNSDKLKKNDKKIL